MKVQNEMTGGLNRREFLSTISMAAGLLSLGLSPGAAAVEPGSSRYGSNVPDSIKYIPPNDPRFNWWREARFGMFIHWGPSALIGTEISWSRDGARRDRNETAEDVAADDGYAKGVVPPQFYDNLYKQFDPEKFNAKEWFDIIKATGVRYVVLVTKHHDGFCMFDSKYTDYKITNTPFKRDVCAEFAKACHDAGIRLGFYYSPPDWHHPDFFTAYHDRYLEYFHHQVRELLTNYGDVSVLWFDREFGQNTPETWGDDTLFPMIRQLQPNVLVSNKAGGWGDFGSQEDGSGYNDTKTWECCTTATTDQWGWRPYQPLKPLSECLQTLLRTVGGDGNLLLNMNPNPEGELDPRIVGRFKEIGAWLGQYGESVYGTRGGPYVPGSWGACTRKGNIIYLHIFSWSGNDVVLPLLSGKNISKAEVLTGGTVDWKADDSDLTFTVPQENHQPIDTIIKLELDGLASDIKAIDTPVSLSGKGDMSRISASNVYGHDPGWGPDKAVDGDPNSRWATDDATHQAWLEVDMRKLVTIKQIQIDEPAEYQRIQSFELQYKDGADWKIFYTGTRIGPGFETPAFDPPITCRKVRLNLTKSTGGPTISEIHIIQ